ncbi:MAG: MarR family transcriptional regulator [Pseudomonadota bacterium]
MDTLERQLQIAIQTIVRIQKILEPSVQTAHGALKLGPPDIQTLRFIAQNPGCMSGTVAEFLGVVPTTMTSIIDRLVKRGFVLRERPADNRRALSLSLTDEGARVQATLDQEERQSSAAMLAILPEEERAGFVRSMNRIAAALSDMSRQTA